MLGRRENCLNNINWSWTDTEANDSHFVAAKMKLWRSSFWDWFCDCVVTSDESDSNNPVKHAPQYRYLKEIDTIERESKVTVICKARRMFISHYEHAKTLWSFLFVPFSKNLMVSKKENDIKDALRFRILAAYYRLDKRFPCHIELRSRQHIHELEIIHPDSNFGSHILGLPSGSDQMRSYTATRVFLDELAFWEKRDQDLILDALKPAIYGDGKASIISTPNPGTKFEQLVTDLNGDIPMRNIMTGLDVANNKLNQSVIFLHYSADPAKRSQEWLYKEKFGTTIEGVPIAGCSGVDEFTWRKEYELSFDFPKGEPVVPEFKKELHCTAYTSYGQFIKDKPLEVGVDFGSRFPAAVFMQRDSLNRLIIHDGLLPANENLDRFLIRVDNFIKTRFPDAKKINFYCDPAGASRSGQGTAPPAVEFIYNFFKIKPQYRMSKPSDRARGIRKLASQLIGTAPGLIVNPLAGRYISGDGKEETGIIPKAFTTGWIYDDVKKDKLEPLKDGFFDHLMDALGYAFIYLYPNLVTDKQDNPRFKIHLPQRLRPFLRR